MRRSGRTFPAPAVCHINSPDGGGNKGICFTTSSPAVDPNRQFVYSYGLDGAVHKYAVGTGEEITGAGWPEMTTKKPFDEKGSSALSIATARNGTSYLYVTHAGYPLDRNTYGDIQGHLTTINLATGAQKVFNAVCSDKTGHLGANGCPVTRAGVWARSGVVYDPDLDRIFIATGNGRIRPRQALLVGLSACPESGWHGRWRGQPARLLYPHQLRLLR